ncbi:MAG: hypothetical protein JNK82_15440 [Myxococcaceae bacterium]|nr:hypothetical protein [Myxococcaceae bacterium]
MTLALLALLTVGQFTPEAAPEATTPDPGWAREGAITGMVLSAVPVGLSVASIVSMWRNEGTAADWFTVASIVSAPLVALIPTFSGRSAVLPEELARRPRIFRIIGWVITVYGAVSSFAGFGIGKLASSLLSGTDFEQYTQSNLGKVIGTVTTLLGAAIAVTGIMFISSGSMIAARRAEEASVSPTVAVVPMPGGGYAMFGGLNGRW